MEVPGRAGAGLAVTAPFGLLAAGLGAVVGLEAGYVVGLVVVGLAAGAFLIDSSRRFCRVFISVLTASILVATCSFT